jgi:hypothetical protein
LAPAFTKLGLSFKDADNVMIAEMDADAMNVDHKTFEVKGLPTLLYFPADDKSHPQKFHGAREVDDMSAFIEENAGAARASDKVRTAPLGQSTCAPTQRLTRLAYGVLTCTLAIHARLLGSTPGSSSDCRQV